MPTYGYENHVTIIPAIADPSPKGEVREVAEARLKEEADVFKRKQKAERATIEARDAKAKADAVAVAEAERIDEERRLTGIWSLRFQDAGPSTTPYEVIDERAKELGIPLAALRDSAGNLYGNAHGVDVEWAKRCEANARQVEREREAERQAALDRLAARQLEWEQNLADQQRLEA